MSLTKNNLMTEIIEPNNREELLTVLNHSHREIADFVQSVEEENFGMRRDDKWSIGENLEHLILSHKGIISVTGKPKSIFAPFGKAERPSGTFSEITDRYHNKLSGGLKAPSKFSPDPDAPKSKTELLAGWKMLSQKLAARLPENWTEADLDTYQLPHPAFGMLTMREMLYFIIFHNGHHLNAMKKNV